MQPKSMSSVSSTDVTRCNSNHATRGGAVGAESPTPWVVAWVDAVEDDSESEYTGYEYVYDGNDALCFDWLPDGEYLYGFCIDDIFGNTCVTDAINFTIDGEDIYFDDLQTN